MAEGTALSAAESPGLRSPFPHPDRSQLETELGTGHSIFCYRPKIRKMICTTNAIESLHMQLWKVLKNRGTSQTTNRR
jgi:transposase-like protein